MGIYRNRELYERATAFGNYDLPESFPKDSPYREYHDTGFGPKFRIHPLAAAIARKQLKGLEGRTTLLRAQMQKLNDRLAGLPGISAQHCRPDAKRVYWAANLLFLDEAKAGCPKDALIKALRAEGVLISSSTYPEQHRIQDLLRGQMVESQTADPGRPARLRRGEPEVGNHALVPPRGFRTGRPVRHRV